MKRIFAVLAAAVLGAAGCKSTNGVPVGGSPGPGFIGAASGQVQTPLGSGSASIQTPQQGQNSIQQTQYRPGAGAMGGVQQSGGVVPGGMNAGVQPAVGQVPAGQNPAACTSANCLDCTTGVAPLHPVK